VEQHDLFAQAKADAAALFPGAEEGDKYFLLYFLRHADAVIGHPDGDFFIRVGIG
jgi:hypothetical protein